MKVRFSRNLLVAALTTTALIGLTMAVLPASAADSPSNAATRRLINVGMSGTDFGSPLDTANELPYKIGFYIGAFLSVLGVIIVFYYVYAGYLWTTAQGDGKKVDEAKAIMKNATIGSVICFAVWGLTYFVTDKILTAAGDTGGWGENRQLTPEEAQQAENSRNQVCNDPAKVGTDPACWGTPQYDDYAKQQAEQEAQQQDEAARQNVINQDQYNEFNDNSGSLLDFESR